MSRQPDPWPSLLARLRKIEETLRRIGNASPFFGTGFHPNGQGGMDSDNYEHGVSGFSLRGSDGYLEVNDIELRGGIIGNEALTSPVRGNSAYAYGSGFAVTTTGTTPLATQSWFTPEGFTTASIFIIGRVYAVNSTAGLDYLSARSRIFVPSTGVEGYGYAMPLPVSANGGSGINQSPIAGTIDSLTTGQEIRLEVQGWTSFANWAASGSNIADVAGQIIWTR
jgi:hypothetical protein